MVFSRCWLMLALVLSAINSGEVQALPGISTPIQNIYVVGHSHLDIGFTDTPSAVAAGCASQIQSQFSFAQTHPDYKFNIEATWQLEQWLASASPSTTTAFMQMVQLGRISIGALHSNQHSAKVSVEELPRLLWSAGQYRDQFNIAIETAFHDDVPGVAWTYPQVLARSGIKYLVCGENLFIGGGFTQPYNSYPFYWKALDGSSVLAWSSRKGYTEAFDWYGLPFFSSGAVDKDRLTTSLLELTNAGYPYDALMVQYAFDNAYSTAHYDAIVNWNATYDNPKFIFATPEDFFRYLEPKYSAQIPTREGNWTTIWDSGSQIEPQGDKIVRNAKDLLPAAEKMASLASVLGIGTYPAATISNAWEQILTCDEHSGAGAGWDGYWTQAQTDQNNLEYRTFTLNVRDWTTQVLNDARQALLSAAADPTQESIVVFNPLSWERTDLVKVDAPQSLLSSQFRLIDATSSTELPYQKDIATSQILFVAPDVPSVGYKRFLVSPGIPTFPAGSLVTAPTSIENDRYRVVLDSNGYVSSFYDKLASRENVNQSSPVQFNRAVAATNQEHFFGTSTPVPHPASATISVTHTGPVAATIRVINSAHPIYSSEFTLYQGLDRMDIVNTADRSQMTFAAYNVNSRYYSMAYPFNLSGSRARIETASAWLDPGSTHTLAGSYTGSHIPQHCIDLSLASYGMLFASPDVYGHSFGSLQTSSFSPSTPPTIFSKFIRYGDQTMLQGSVLGTVDAEPGAPVRWPFSYSLRAHARAFDTAADARFGWEVGTPLVSHVVSAAPGAQLSASAGSLLAINAPGVIITGVKKAETGAGYIVRLQEIAGVAANASLVSTIRFITNVAETTPLEADFATLYTAPPGSGGQAAIPVSISPYQMKTLRVQFGLPVTAAGDWSYYQ